MDYDYNNVIFKCDECGELYCDEDGLMYLVDPQELDDWLSEHFLTRDQKALILDHESLADLFDGDAGEEYYCCPKCETQLLKGSESNAFVLCECGEHAPLVGYDESLSLHTFKCSCGKGHTATSGYWRLDPVAAIQRYLQKHL